MMLLALALYDRIGKFVVLVFRSVLEINLSLTTIAATFKLKRVENFCQKLQRKNIPKLGPFGRLKNPE